MIEPISCSIPVTRPHHYHSREQRSAAPEIALETIAEASRNSTCRCLATSCSASENRSATAYALNATPLQSAEQQIQPPRYQAEVPVTRDRQTCSATAIRARGMARGPDLLLMMPLVMLGRRKRRGLLLRGNLQVSWTCAVRVVGVHGSRHQSRGAHTDG